MKNDSPLNFNCEFSREIVDLLYGEIAPDRKNAFELHLSKCSDCSAELANFSDIRFAVQDWKTAEFDKLATPTVVIPYKTAEVKTVETESSGSWFDAFRNYLRLSPVLSGATAVLIVALFAFGFFIVSESDEGMVAVTDRKPDVQQAVPSVKPPAAVEKTVPGEVSESNDFDDVVTENIVKSAESERKTDDSVPVRVNNRSVAANKSRPVKTVEKSSPVNRSKNDGRTAKTPVINNKPRLNELPEEVEDNSLRLADLFADIDTRE